MPLYNPATARAEIGPTRVSPFLDRLFTGPHSMGTTLSSETLDPRRRKILFRAWHRGTREMDLLMGRYADHALAGLSSTDLDAFEALIEVPDRDLFAWVTGAAPVPANYDTGVFRSLRAFHVDEDAG